MAAGGGAGTGAAGMAAGGGAGDGMAGGGAGGSAGTGSGDPCATAAICDDFEGGMDAGWTIQPNSTPAPVVDATKGAHGSSSSLKVDGTSSQAFITFPVPGQAFYVRANMQFAQGTAQMTGHGWFIVGADNITQGDANQMRFGSSGNHGHNEIDFNVYGDGCNGEKTQFSDGASDGASGWTNTPYDRVLLDADKWYCVEAFFNGPADEFQLWIDGTEVPGLHVTPATMCASWAPTYTHIKFGAGANSSIGNIWYDDVAVSTARLGCP
jgi:hypothetical protein